MFGSPPKREAPRVDRRQGEHGVGIASSAAVLSPCIVTARMAAPCDHCGRQASPVHMPRREHGLYCAKCCPVCSREVH